MGSNITPTEGTGVERRGLEERGGGLEEREGELEESEGGIGGERRGWAERGGIGGERKGWEESEKGGELENRLQLRHCCIGMFTTGELSDMRVHCLRQYV